MNSRIIDQDYIHWEETKQWDTIIAKCMEMMYQTSIANDGRIVLDLSEEECDEDNFLIKVAKLCNTAETFPIYLNTNYWRCRKIIRANPTYTIKKLNRKGKKTYIPISMDGVKNYIQLYMPRIYTEDLFERIYAEYWDEVLNSVEVEPEEEARIED